MTLSLRYFLLVLVAAFLAPVARADELPTFRLTIKAGRFEPDTIDVPAGTKFRLLIKNEGPGAAEFESKELRKEKVLAPSVESFLIFAPMKPGTYRFFEDFHPEIGQGRFVIR